MRPTLADDALMPADAPLASPSPEIAITERTIRRVVLGDIVFDTWYPSYYPEELVGRQQATLYVCQWCFKYCVDDGLAVAHRVGRLSSYDRLRGYCSSGRFFSMRLLRARLDLLHILPWNELSWSSFPISVHQAVGPPFVWFCLLRF